MSEVEDKSAPATADEKTQIKWLTRCFFLAAVCYMCTYAIGFRYSIGYIVTSTISPSVLASKDPSINEKFATYSQFTTTIILIQRIINLLTGTALGEWGQVIGRKKLVFIAVIGYAVGSLAMLLGYLTSKPYTWEECYKPCEAKVTNVTGGGIEACVATCVTETKGDGSHFNGEAFYWISQGIIGFCAPFSITASSFAVDSSTTEKSFVENFAYMRAWGYGGGLSFGYFWGLVLLIVFYVGMKNTAAFLIAAFIFGIVFGLIGVAFAGLKLKEPLKEDQKKKCCANPADYMFWNSLLFPFKMGKYTLFLYLTNGMYAFYIAYWESTALHYFLWNYGVSVVMVFIAVILIFAMQLVGIKVLVPRLGFRRAIYFGFPILVTGVSILAFTVRGPNDTAKSQPTGLLVVIFGGICAAGQGMVQSSTLALYNSQGGKQDTGPIGGAWKTGEAFFKLMGSICAAAFYPGHVRRVGADSSILPGIHWIIFGFPAIILLITFFIVADQCYGDLAKEQKYQEDVIIFGWGATAKKEFDNVETAKNVEVADSIDK